MQWRKDLIIDSVYVALARAAVAQAKVQMNQQEAQKLAERWYSEQVVLVPSSEPVSIYNFSPDQYWFFLVHDPFLSRTGASRYLAVDKWTGEVRDAGWAGE